MPVCLQARSCDIEHPLRATPLPALVAQTSGVNPVAASYWRATSCTTPASAEASTSAIAQPPKPPPVIRAPNTPASERAMPAMRSSSGQLTS